MAERQGTRPSTLRHSRRDAASAASGVRKGGPSGGGNAATNTDRMSEADAKPSQGPAKPRTPEAEDPKLTRS
eukprot:gene16128-biopygen8429